MTFKKKKNPTAAPLGTLFPTKSLGTGYFFSVKDLRGDHWCLGTASRHVPSFRGGFGLRLAVPAFCRPVPVVVAPAGNCCILLCPRQHGMESRPSWRGKTVVPKSLGAGWSLGDGIFFSIRTAPKGPPSIWNQWHEICPK